MITILPCMASDSRLEFLKRSSQDNDNWLEVTFVGFPDHCTYGTAYFGSVLSVRVFEAVGEQLTVAKSLKMQDDVSIHQDLVVDSTIYVG